MILMRCGEGTGQSGDLAREWRSTVLHKLYSVLLGYPSAPLIKGSCIPSLEALSHCSVVSVAQQHTGPQQHRSHSHIPPNGLVCKQLVAAVLVLFGVLLV